MTQHYHVAIIGGGLVGCVTAIALAKNSSQRILLIDAKKNQLLTKHNSLDTRTLVLNYASCEFLSLLDLWPALENFTHAIHRIYISEKNALGSCLLSAEEVGHEYLGQVIEIADLQQQLLSALRDFPHIDFWDETQVAEVHPLADQQQLILIKGSEPHAIHCDYLVLADGTDSKLRDQLGITSITHDYQQHAIAAVAQLTEPHPHTAYERFAGEEILAILPMNQQRVGTVLSCPNELTRELLNFDDASYMGYIEDILGFRLGKLQAIGPRRSYPLTLSVADHFVKHNIILLGNTAHTFNPIGAQGLNLGLAGVSDFVTTLRSEPHNLSQFATRQKTRVDHLKKFTHQTIELFASDAFATQIARRAALVGLDFIPSIKQRFIRQMMGF